MISRADPSLMMVVGLQTGAADDIINISPPRDRARIKRRLAKIARQDGSEVDFPRITNMVGGRLGIRDTPPLIYHPEGACHWALNSPCLWASKIP
jgi:hypothetical protein